MSQEFISDIFLGLIPRCKICKSYVWFDEYYNNNEHCVDCEMTCEIINNDFPLVDEFEGCCENCYGKSEELEDVWDIDEKKWIKVCPSCYIDCQMNGLGAEI